MRCIKLVSNYFPHFFSNTTLLVGIPMVKCGPGRYILEANGNDKTPFPRNPSSLPGGLVITRNPVPWRSLMDRTINAVFCLDNAITRSLSCRTSSPLTNWARAPPFVSWPRQPTRRRYAARTRLAGDCTRSVSRRLCVHFVLFRRRFRDAFVSISRPSHVNIASLIAPA